MLRQLRLTRGRLAIPVSTPTSQWLARIMMPSSRPPPFLNRHHHHLAGMAQTPEAQAFIQRVLAPNLSPDDILQPSLDDETHLRRLFATDKQNARLQDPYVGLVDVFAAPDAVRTTRARVVAGEDDRNAKYVMPLPDKVRRKDGEPSMVADLEEFKRNWGVFSEGSLSQLLDWNNVVAAGGAVLACLTPLSTTDKASKRAIRKHYHTTAYPTSDVDLFLWGLTPEQAEAKIVQIYEAVRDSVPWDVTCIRTKHTVSIHSQYPYRSVQIVLRLYSSPAEVLAGFDIDAPCVLYNGNRVFANPRSIIAMMRQCNTVDMTRRSPSYEVRLDKYSRRGYEVYVPTLSRPDIDPTIYERAIGRITGLARLLVLEKHTDADARFNFLESRRTLRGRPNPLNRYSRRKRKYKGDLKTEMGISGLEMNDYDVASLHIPYGPSWDARRIDRLVYQTDLGMNSTFNPKNKGRRLHRHPAFFGTIEECLEDCCENCPQPIDEAERKLHDEESENYIHGRIKFVQENPGRQSISGSFNPIDVGEWSALVYVGPTEKFFATIANGDRAAVAQLLKDGQDVNQRDHVGRMPLHVAILSRQVEIACDLVDAGARMTARLVDGRTSLHLAAQMDLLVVVKKLLDRSAANKEKIGSSDSDDESEKMEVDDSEEARMSSEDDWSSEEEDDMAMSDEDGEDGGSEDTKPKKKTAEDNAADQPVNVGDLPDEGLDTPDVFDINLVDWDLTYSPLAYAIVFGSLPILEMLFEAGADAKTALQNKNQNTAVLPLTLTVICEDDERTCKIAERLIEAGASCSAMESDGEAVTVFRRAVEANRANLVATFLRCDPNAKTALNYPQVGWSGAVTPLVSAVSSSLYSTVVVLLAYNAKMDLTQEEVDCAKRYNYVSEKSNNTTIEPTIARHDDLVRLLAELGADINTGVRQAMRQHSAPQSRRTFLNWVRYGITWAEKQIKELDEKINPAAAMDTTDAADDSLTGWARHLRDHVTELERKEARDTVEQKGTMHKNNLRSRGNWVQALGYFRDTEQFLIDHGAKTWAEVFPDQVSTASEDDGANPRHAQRVRQQTTTGENPKYQYISSDWHAGAVPKFSEALYDELYEAAFTGDNERVQALCLPAKGEKDFAPLQIAVYVSDESGNRYIRNGYTPLYAAIANKHWDTARLIVAICAAQYKEPENNNPFRVEVELADDRDSDIDSDGYDSDGTVDHTPIDFVDIARRPSTVQCKASPKALLEAGHVEPFYLAVTTNDYDLFLQAFRLFKHAPIPTSIPKHLLDNIIQNDRPEMLDEFIRRTGRGIRIEVAKTEGLAPVVNDKNKVYLGLNVHGKKRTDLAKRNDPNGTGNDDADAFQAPLVWKAVSFGSTKVLDYLLGPRPLEAYRYYAATTNSDTARLLKRTADLETKLPEWLGLAISPVGESPLTAALINLKLDMLKYLSNKVPQLFEAAMDQQIKFLGVNPVSIAVQLNCESKLIDFLLSRGSSPACRDQNRGWNIFHYMAHKKEQQWMAAPSSSKLLTHMLKKLPRDVVEALLTQQSYKRLNTPLHVAVQAGNLAAVKLILGFSKSTVLVRNVSGSIPLHVAIRPGYAEIVKLLIDAAPEGLHMENAVGETPLEMASLQATISRNDTIRYSRQSNVVELGNPAELPARVDVPRLEKELPRVRATLAGLVETGVVKTEDKVHEQTVEFVEFMEAKVVETKATMAAEAAETAAKDKDAASTAFESPDASKTWEVLRDAVAKHPGKRRLVHLLDVQASVQDSLARVKGQEEDKIRRLIRNDDYYGSRRTRTVQKRLDKTVGLEQEEDPDEQYLKNSLIFKHLITGPE
ncbi:Ankyrin repeat protein [Mycena chlorophos]|uniref:Ankyrin repeat protein n=1 Tax=Mycena chlorophos TaxID=658473 RepID=A0A8H6S4R6_MYCCL|nr:Ankyrin repeat protein [Mycena chlorophos]